MLLLLLLLLFLFYKLFCCGCPTMSISISTSKTYCEKISEQSRKRTTKWQKGDRLNQMRKGGTICLLRFGIFPHFNKLNVCCLLAVKRVRLLNQSISTVACDLGLPERTLRRWVTFGFAALDIFKIPILLHKFVWFQGTWTVAKIQMSTTILFSSKPYLHTKNFHGIYSENVVINPAVKLKASPLKPWKNLEDIRKDHSKNMKRSTFTRSNASVWPKGDLPKTGRRYANVVVTRTKTHCIGKSIFVRPHMYSGVWCCGSFVDLDETRF